MEVFYRDWNPHNLSALLSTDLKMQGPLFRFTTSADYIKSLRENPPIDLDYEVVHDFESGDTACIIYTIKKATGDFLVAQTFRVRNDKIDQILIVFDSARMVEDAVE